MKTLRTIGKALCFLFVMVPLATGQDSDKSYSDLSREELAVVLNEKVDKIQNLRTSYYQGLRERERKIQSAIKKRSSLTSQLETLKRRKRERTDKLSDIRKRISAKREKIDALDALTTTIQQNRSSFQQRLTSYIRRTIPYRRSTRLERAEISPSSGSGNQGKSEPVQALRELWQQAMTEFRNGRTADVRKQDVEFPDGRTKFARVARIGHRIQFFVTQDGNQAGLWIPSVGQQQNWTVTLIDDRAPFIRSLNMIRGQTAPARVLFPVPVKRK